MQPRGSFSFLQTGQQDGQHGFLHMETILGLVKDLVLSLIHISEPTRRS